MEIKICQNKQEWDSWVSTLRLTPFAQGKPAEFLQSWDWGEFQKNVGNDVLRLQVVDGGQVLWQGQGFTHRLGLGMKYLYAPRMQNADNRMQSVCDFLRGKGFAFVRIEPDEELGIMNYAMPAGRQELRTTKNRQPQNTLVLNISKTEEEFLAAMHEKTRYNIRLAEKKGVVIKSEKNIDVFWQLNLATTERDKFRSHPKEYYRKMLENNFCRQLTAYYPFDSLRSLRAGSFDSAPLGLSSGRRQGKPIAAILLAAFGDTITYLHGVSGNEHRNLMSPYLLQWEGIKLGKKLGCQYYDFGGIAPDAKLSATTSFNNFCWPADHPWTGITRFKAGFGGERRDYPGAVDVVLSGWRYVLYKIAARLVKSIKSLKL
ncbi:MAG: peptidoglycan bridge formation glycyltransferase FemA/FemB family protein [Candidatus Magasanikbacteria bacterium]|nr:peptidoglycan bridge formation glycyltransferase FemA/FemB family protein [Candidatus Magasanikbacteria bacterium]